jgi:LPXTG-motif cell wall-anchored protein
MVGLNVCELPETGSSLGVFVFAIAMFLAGVLLVRFARRSSQRLSVIVAPLILIAGLGVLPETGACSSESVTTTTEAVTTTTEAVPPTTELVTTTTEAVTTTTVLATCAGGRLCEVGDTGPGGGTIIYVDLSLPEGSQFYEAACDGWVNNCDGISADFEAKWGCETEDIGAINGTLIGSGEENSAEILAGCQEEGIAARVADQYSNNGFDDWFLPSRDELNAMCKWAFGDTVNEICNNNGLGGLSVVHGNFAAGRYWASTAKFNQQAYRQKFSDGQQGNNIKQSVYYVRPIRSF